MQTELETDYPEFDFQLVGVNKFGKEAGNDLATDGRDIPLLQDVDADSDGASDAWTEWNVEWRDVVIVDATGAKVGTFNLTKNDLADADNYATLRQMLIDAANLGQPKPPPVAGLDLLAVSDSGADPTDNRTNFNNSSSERALLVRVAGVTDGAIVRLFADGIQIGQATASGSEVVITSDGSAELADGPRSLTATQQTDGPVSDASAPLNVTIDTAIAPITPTPPSVATVDLLYAYNAQNSEEEEAGFIYTLTDAPAGATIDASSGLLNWTPTAGQVGEQHFSIVATDLAGNERIEPVDLTVTHQETAKDDQFDVDEDSHDFVLDVLANDSLPGASASELEITSVGLPDNGGTVRISDDSSYLLYSPAPDFTGNELFTYQVAAGTASDQATARIRLQPVNDPPLAVDDTFAAIKDAGASVFDVLANDSTFPDSNEQLAVDQVSQGTQGGAVAVSDDGLSVIYTPRTGFTGEESFTYTLRDDGGATAEAAVTVTVRDFVPSSLSGFVYIDVDDDGFLDPEEQPICDAEVTLVGTDFMDQPVSLTQPTAADGSYAFHNLAPGQYRIIESHPEFLADGRETIGSHGGKHPANDEFAIELGQGVEGTNYNFGERGRQAEFIGIVDFFASAPRQGIVAALSRGGGPQWHSGRGDWMDHRSVDIEWSPDRSTVQVTAVDGSDDVFTDTFSTHDVSRIRSLGDRRGARLVQIRGPMSQLGPSAAFPNQVADSRMKPAAEGESQTAPRSSIPWATGAEFLPYQTGADQGHVAARRDDESTRYELSVDKVLADDLWFESL